MEEKVLQILLELKDNVSDKMKSIGENAEGSLGKIQKASAITAAASTAVFAATIKIGSDAVNAYKEVELVNKQFENAVKGVSKATDEQAKALEDIIALQEKKGVVDGDSLKLGVAQLSTFGLSTGAVTNLTKSLADLTVNQAGVNATGKDFEMNANTIAKALNGQFGVLEKSGIRFTEHQQAMIKNGTEAQKVAAINEGLAQNLKLTNESARDTAAGMSAHLNVALGTVQENIGAKLLPILVRLMEKITPIIEKVADWADKNSDLVAKILVGVGIISGLIAVLAVVATVATTVAAIMGGGLVASVAAVIAVVVAAIAMFFVFKDNILKAVNDVWQGIKAVFSAIGNWITDRINDAMKPIQNIINMAQKAIDFVGKIGGGGAKDSRASGGYVNGSGDIRVHDGEYVLSNEMLSGQSPIDRNVLAAIGGSAKPQVTTVKNDNSISIGTVHTTEKVDLNDVIKHLSWQLRYSSI